MYDYLAILKSLFGVKTPIGIMTTYDGWRFCRLKEGKLTEDRVFLATDEIKSNLHLHTISALLQMNNPEMDDVKITADTCFPHLSPGTFTFKALGQNENQLSDGFPGPPPRSPPHSFNSFLPSFLLSIPPFPPSSPPKGSVSFLQISFLTKDVCFFHFLSPLSVFEICHPAKPLSWTY